MIGGWDAKFSGGPHDGMVKPLRGLTEPPDFLFAVTTPLSTAKSRAPHGWEPAADCVHPGDQIGVYWRAGQIPAARIAGYVWTPPERPDRNRRRPR